MEPWNIKQIYADHIDLLDNPDLTGSERVNIASRAEEMIGVFAKKENRKLTPGEQSILDASRTGTLF